MLIYVNGEEQHLTAQHSLADWLSINGVLGQKIAVEVNESIVPSSQFSDYYIKAGDRVEVITAVGGG